MKIRLKDHDVCYPSELCKRWPVCKERDVNIVSPNGGIFVNGRHSSVGKENCYGPDGQRIESAPIQTGSGDHPGFNSIGITPGHGVGHLTSPSTQVQEGVELYVYSPFGISRPF